MVRMVSYGCKREARVRLTEAVGQIHVVVPSHANQPPERTEPRRVTG